MLDDLQHSKEWIGGIVRRLLRYCSQPIDAALVPSIQHKTKTSEAPQSLRQICRHDWRPEHVGAPEPVQVIHAVFLHAHELVLDSAHRCFDGSISQAVNVRRDFAQNGSMSLQVEANHVDLLQPSSSSTWGADIVANDTAAEF